MENIDYYTTIGSLKKQFLGSVALTQGSASKSTAVTELKLALGFLDLPCKQLAWDTLIV